MCNVANAKKKSLKCVIWYMVKNFCLIHMKKYFGSSTNFQGEDTSSQFLFLFAQFVFKSI